MVFKHSRLIKSKQVRFQIFNTRPVNCYCSLLLFCVRENPFSRVSKNSSSVSKLDPRFSKLKNSSLETRFSIRENIEDRVSSRDCQLTFARYCMYVSFFICRPTFAVIQTLCCWLMLKSCHDTNTCPLDNKN